MNINEKKKAKKKVSPRQRALRTVKIRIPALHNAIRTLQHKLYREFPKSLDKLGKKGKTRQLASKLRVHYRIFLFLSRDIFRAGGKIFFTYNPLAALTEILYLFYLQSLNTQISLALGKTPRTPSSLKWIAHARAVRIESLGVFLFFEGKKLLKEASEHPMVPQFIEDVPKEMEPEEELPRPAEIDYDKEDEKSEEEILGSREENKELANQLVTEFPQLLGDTLRLGSELLFFIGKTLPYLTQDEYKIFMSSKSAIDYLITKIDSYADETAGMDMTKVGEVLALVGQAHKYFKELDATLRGDEGELPEAKVNRKDKRDATNIY